MLEPIMDFKTKEELEKCAEEWKKILFLDNWIISVRLQDCSELEGEVSGTADIDTVHQCSIIRIARLNEDLSSRIMKVCMEETLVHELLHCKYDMLTDRLGSIESVLYEMREHTLLEEMARSLIMVKYNLSKEWFINKEYL